MTLQLVDGKSGKAVEILVRGCEAAASLLRDLSGQALDLAVTHVDFQTLETRLAGAEIGDPLPVAGASQEFAGGLSGQVSLVFEAGQGLSLARALLRQHREPDFMTEIDQSALTEIANIVINACLDDLAKGCKGDVTSTAPIPIRGSLATILHQLQAQAVSTLTLSLKLAFSLPQGKVMAGLLFSTPAEGFAKFWRAAVRDIRIPVPLHG